jgi:hypothetical protein
VFLTGYIAGVHFVQMLAKAVAGDDIPGIVSVGRTSEGDMEALAHDSLDEAFDHVVVMLFPYAVVMTLEGDLYRWHVCRTDVPDDMVATVHMRAFVTGDASEPPGEQVPLGYTVTTSTPVTARAEGGDDFDEETFLDGFAAGLDAEDHAFAITFGTLDVMAGLLLPRRALTPQELR